MFWANAGSVMLQVGVMSLPLTRGFLRTERLDIGHWAVVLFLSLLPVTVVETTKLVRAAIRRRRSPPP